MMSSRFLFGFAAITLSATAQRRGTNFQEVHPPLPSKVCVKTTDGATCATEASSIVIDADQRVINAVGTQNKCFADGKWNSQICSSPTECAKTCGLEGVAYETDHGITTSDDAVHLKINRVPDMSPRVYMLDASGKKYKLFQLLNQEFTFDVDVSSMPCGTNGALYFVKMDADGGTARFPDDTAGAAYGTGYCDAQCPQTKFINGEANLNKTFGSCCSEMDIWEANSMATSFASHPCSTNGQQRCINEAECGTSPTTQYTGWCDKAGCSFKPYRLGDRLFYGRGKEFDIDTTRPFTVITQFVTKDNTTTGELVEIRRLYKQDNRVVPNPESTWPQLHGIHSLTDAMCSAYKTFFGEHPYQMGRLAQLGKQLIGGMTLVMSSWVDYSKNMTWLDSYETGKDPSVPGVLRGPCPNPGGDPATVLAKSPNAGVQFSNFRSGDFGSTY